VGFYYGGKTMTTTQILQTGFEILFGAALVAGAVFEQKLVNFEERIAQKWRVKK
jgi:hypothetical protein